MSLFGDLIRQPFDIHSSKFKKREGQPFVQGIARNMGHSLFGDHEANKFEQKYLGDGPNGEYRWTAENGSSIIPSAVVQPTQQQQPVMGPTGDQTNQMLEAYMQRMAQGQTLKPLY